MENERIYDCPLCSNQFAGANCHSSCPMAPQCRMVKCPRCNYEFVEDGLVANFVKSLIERFSPGAHR